MPLVRGFAKPFQRAVLIRMDLRSLVKPDAELVLRFWITGIRLLHRFGQRLEIRRRQRNGSEFLSNAALDRRNRRTRQQNKERQSR